MHFKYNTSRRNLRLQIDWRGNGASRNQSQQVQEKSACYYRISPRNIWKILLTSRAKPCNNTSILYMPTRLILYLHICALHVLANVLYIGLQLIIGLIIFDSQSYFTTFYCRVTLSHFECMNMIDGQRMRGRLAVTGFAFRVLHPIYTCVLEWITNVLGRYIKPSKL